MEDQRDVKDAHPQARNKKSLDQMEAERRAKNASGSDAASKKKNIDQLIAARKVKNELNAEATGGKMSLQQIEAERTTEKTPKVEATGLKKSFDQILAERKAVGRKAKDEPQAQAARGKKSFEQMEAEHRARKGTKSLDQIIAERKSQGKSGAGAVRENLKLDRTNERTAEIPPNASREMERPKGVQDNASRGDSKDDGRRKVEVDELTERFNRLRLKTK